ncbi:MAG: helix-turn-helix domain-containing protein [Acholeplasmatales bacterium]|jgi:DNA-binding IclR family transcriptional regulator|nr:helix-turn-helix domain-containing protein [Acholeplasmatales bacterium]
MINNTVAKTFHILDLISKNSDGLTLSEIYKELNYSKSTTYDILKTLYKMDAIYYKDQRIKNYVIGSKMFQIGNTYIKHSSIIEASNKLLKSFSEKNETIVFISKRIDNKIIFVYKYQPNLTKVSTPLGVGSIEYDFNLNSVGKTYGYFDRNYSNYKKDEQVVKDGFVIDNPQCNCYLKTYSVPIYNFENRVCGVISSYNLASDDISDDSINDFVNIGKEISKRLGYIWEEE